MWIDCLRLVIFSCIFYESAIVALPSYRETNINRQRQYWMRRNQISETTTIKPPHNTVYSNDFVLGPNKVRHQSRFAKFDTVKRMIDNRVLTTSPKPLMNHREHHTSAWNYNYNKAITTDKGIFDSDFYVFGNDDYYEDDDAVSYIWLLFINVRNRQICLYIVYVYVILYYYDYYLRKPIRDIIFTYCV